MFEFYKIIHPSTTPDECITLPLKFVRKFGNELSDVALLEVPGGKSWHVELRKTDGRILFHNGWEEFVDYYSISIGHFLVFKYRGNSNFHVLIFDMTCCEISYPPNVDDLEELNSGKDTEDGSTPGILDVSSDGQNSLIKEEELDGMSSRKRTAFTRSSAARKSKVIAQEENEAIGVPSSLNLDHPSFSVVMKPSYLKKGNYTTVPLSFVRRHLENGLGSLILEDSDRRKWPVSFRYYKGHCAHLCSGWPVFVKANRLKLGDVCVFEKIESSLLKVHIIRNHESLTPTTLKMEEGHQSSEKQENSGSVRIGNRHSCTKASVPPKVMNEAIAESRLLKLKHPSFEVVMKPAYLNCGSSQPFPMKFIREYMEKEFSNVTLQVSDVERTWPVGVLTYPKYARLSRGWRNFVSENNIKEEDVCVFELIDKEDCVFKVHILKNRRT